MAKMSLLFLAACTACALDLTLGLGYYFSAYPNADGIYNFVPSYTTILQDKNKKEEEGKESSSNEDSKKNSNEEGSSEEKPNSEKGGSEEKKEGRNENNGEGESGEGKEMKDNKKASLEMKPKEIKYVFPPSSYTFPETKLPQILLSPVNSYSYLPYKSSYVIQQPLTSYPAGDSYQYFALPSSTTVGKTYAVSSSVAKGYSSPVASYSGSSKSILTPGIRVYESPFTWHTPVNYYKI